MSKTRADYLEIVQAEVDDNSTSAISLINQDIQEAYQEILVDTNRYLTPSTSQTISCVVGTGNYTPTTAYTDILAVHYLGSSGDYRQLIQITKDDYLANHINDDNSEPQYWFENAGTVQVVPQPDYAGTLRLEYVPIPSELTADASVSIIPDKYTNVVKLGASYKYLAFDKDPATPEYERMYLQAKDVMERELASKTQPVKPTLYNK